MLIGIDASRANRENRTGTEWYAFHLIRALWPQLHSSDRVRLYVKEPLQKDWGELPNQVTVKILSWPPKFLWTHIRLAWEIFLNRVDVLFIPAHTIPIFSSSPIITTLHDIGFEHSTSLYNNRKIGTQKLIFKILNLFVRLGTFGKYGASELDYHRFSARLALKHSAAITTVSEYSRKDIAKTYNYPIEKIYLIPNGVANNIYNSEIRHHQDKILLFGKRLGINGSYLVNLGRIEKKKNSLLLVQAFHKFISDPSKKNYILLMLGSFGYGSDEVLKYIQNNNLQKNIITPSWVKQEEIPYLIAGAQAFVFPSLFEGFGVPVLEAMAVGTPVICSNSTALPGVVGKAAILIDPSNLDSIVDGINTVVNDKEIQEELRTKGYKQIQQYNWPSSAAKLSSLLHNISKA